MSDGICTTDDCNKVQKARGLCATHLQRLYRSERRWPRTCEGCGQEFLARWHGTRFCYAKCAGSRTTHRAVFVGGGDTGIAPTPSLPAAFVRQDWDGVLAALRAGTETIDGCWVWSGSLNPRGYGLVTLSGRRTAVHRLAAMAAQRSPIASGMQVHHICANTACCNPDHLQVVTPAENAAEMRDRHKLQRRIEALEAALSDLDPGHPLIFNL